MRRRLYFMLPDVGSARQMMDEMLLARIEASHIHFHARPDIALGDLPEASTAQRTAMLLGGEVGIALGAGLGLLAGLLADTFTPWYVPAQTHTILLITIAIGGVCGALWMSLVAMALPNGKLAAFRWQIEQGQVLMMVNVPLRQVEKIRSVMAKKHPEAIYGGTWPTDHVVFP